ncbi:7446_t:CDS:2 [Paraglomus occultum]|uniref:7446_t:CDS:1 n=1 Tax=Paraglomus occultum TaxID=144539 RepID=A0A9N8WEK4_9GLOM|nr:7446_t:CDS:2 [Paraglomus occultum]
MHLTSRYVTSLHIAYPRMSETGINYTNRDTITTLYFQKHSSEKWTYLHFLNDNRSTILTLPPFANTWTGLDGAWRTRFLRIGRTMQGWSDFKRKVIIFLSSWHVVACGVESLGIVDAERLSSLLFSTVDATLLIEQNPNKLRQFWETIIEDRKSKMMEMNVAINYEHASMHLLELAREKKTEAIASIIEECSKNLDSAASVDEGEERGEPNKKRSRSERMPLSNLTNGEFPTKFIEEDFRILRENRIEGIAFLALTEEKLERYGMKGGPANIIVDYIKKLKASFERSPPFSGKTTLTELLSIYLRRLGRTVITITIQESEKHFSSEEAFDAFWIAEAGISWSSCVNAEVQTDILVDEAQILYRHAPWFWSHLKILMQGKNSLMRVLLVSMYGELSGNCISTPITFPQSLGLDDLRLPRREFDTLVENFINIRYKPGFTIPDSTRDAVFKITGGHAGLVRETLRLLRDRSGDGCRGDEMNCFLVSPSYQGLQHQGLCSFYWMQSWVPDADEIEDLPKSADIATRLIHHGIITHAAGERMQFAAPIMRIMLGQRLFYAPASLRSKLPAARNFENFLLRG